MSPRRLAYTRRQVSLIIRITERTLARWHRVGKHFHPFRDPTDALGRWLYDRDEIENYRRRKQRPGSGARRVDTEPREVTLDFASLEPTVPGPVAAAIYEMLAEDVPIEEICRRALVAPEQVIRLDRLRRQFEAERIRAPRTSEKRIVLDDDDPEMEAWGKQLDERRRREQDVSPQSSDDSGGDDGTDQDDEDEDPASGR